MNAVSTVVRSPATLTRLQLDRPLTVRLLKDQETRPLAQVPVSPADFSDVVSEAWRDGCLRAGHPEAPLGAIPMRLSPVFARDSDARCAGFRIKMALPDGKEIDRLFTFRCLRHVADRASLPLLDAEVLEAGGAFLFDVVAEPAAPSASALFEKSPADRDGGHGQADETARDGRLAAEGVSLSFRSTPLAFVRLPLPPLLARATPINVVDEEVPPVIYTQLAFARAEACARRGAATAVETGGALFGSLASCPETGEFFTLVHDVVEVQDAEEARFSLNYSSRSWQRLQRIQQARQAAYPRRADRLIGQAHGHPFRPNDGKICAECLQRPTCTLSSAWASEDDQTWHRAVFARQPWALCHIFGLTARGDEVHQLFGLRDGRLQARGFHLLPEEIHPLSGL